MRPQLIITVFGVFIIGTILACIASGRWLGEEIGIINALASINVASAGVGEAAWSAPKGLVTYWNALITALQWNYPYLSSPWAIFIKFPLWLISLGVVWGFIEVALGLVNGVIGAVRSWL